LFRVNSEIVEKLKNTTKLKNTPKGRSEWVSA
jgi:hypothetical protein